MTEKLWLHGEVCIKKVKGKMPEGMNKLAPINGSYMIAESETTGNHHLLEEVAGVPVFEKDGTLYFRPVKEATVRCVDEKRHDRITLEPCTEDEFYIFDRQQEVDHISDEVRAVRD